MRPHLILLNKKMVRLYEKVFCNLYDDSGVHVSDLLMQQE